jgi:small subunit ribosomal protein S8
MSISDPIADMFTRIRNAILARHDKVVIPFSNMKLSIAKILKDEGFVKYYEILTEDNQKKLLKVGLKYDDMGRSLISNIERVSRPGRRYYVTKKQIPKVLNGFGISILSTPKGVLSGRSARLANVGGEYLGKVH